MTTYYTCTHYTYPPGQNDNHRAAVRCKDDATHRLFPPDSPDNPNHPGMLTCLEHGQAVVEEYAVKLGETWILRPVDEYGRLVIGE